MTPTLSVDPCGRFLGVGRSWETDVGVLSTEITVMTLVDDKGVFGDGGRVDIVGVEEVDEFGGSFGG